MSKLLKGGSATDDRGRLMFVNDFAFDGVRRFYMVENHDLSIIRAWHGHRDEEKWVFVARGTFIVCVVGLDDLENPSKKAPISRYVLSADSPAVLHVPGMSANGFRALEPGSQIAFFSSGTLAEAAGDDFRFPVDYWDSSVWEVINR